MFLRRNDCQEKMHLYPSSFLMLLSNIAMLIQIIECLSQMSRL
uniref:Uncharacterized protein n=1 Tax=Rhizophora mucronata TaxID=61149 RepID=A0A2P2PN27_RHIMU